MIKFILGTIFLISNDVVTVLKFSLVDFVRNSLAEVDGKTYQWWYIRHWKLACDWPKCNIFPLKHQSIFLNGLLCVQ